METLHKVNFLHSVILQGVIIEYVELFMKFPITAK